MTLPRVYPILDTQLFAAKGCTPETAARAWLDGGARMIQFRHKAQWTRTVLEETERIAGICRDYDATFVVNDRADMAKLLGAGLHVGQDDLPPVDARRLIGENAFLGYSTHTAAQLDRAAKEPVSYVALGPIYPTILKQMKWAIGGIKRETARAVWAAGADSVAVISDLVPEESTAANLRRRMEEWQQLAKT